MGIKRRLNIIDIETGEWYYTCYSRYGGHRTLENAIRYCQRHGYKIKAFSDDFTDAYVMVIVEEDK